MQTCLLRHYLTLTMSCENRDRKPAKVKRYIFEGKIKVVGYIIFTFFYVPLHGPEFDPLDEILQVVLIFFEGGAISNMRTERR